MKKNYLKFGVIFIPIIFLALIGKFNSESDLEARSVMRGNGAFPVASRADIVDRTGVVVAYDKKVSSLWIDKRKTPSQDRWLNPVAKALQMKPKDIVEALVAHSRPALIKSRLEMNEVAKLQGMDMKGIEVVETYERLYPYGRLAEDVLGYVSNDNRGAQGVEFFYDNLLWRFTSKDKGRQGNLVLSLHSPAQFAVHNMLEKNLVDFQAKNASFMMMDMENGEIIAMANVSGDKDQEIPYMSNPCISKPVDPTIILGLLDTLNEEAEGKEITLRDKAGCQEPADGFSVCGPLDLTHLKETKLEPEMLKVLWDLGLGKETGIDLPGERSGSFVECFLNPWDSIRHNRINATPLQLLRAFSAMINRGKLIRPKVAMNGDYTGKMDFWHFIKAKDRSSIPPTEKMTLILRSKLAASRVSGLASAYQYTKDLSQLVFLGFGPTPNPRFVYVEIIDGAKAKRPSSLMDALKTAKDLVQDIHLPDENTGPPGLNMASGKNSLSQKPLSRL